MNTCAAIVLAAGKGLRFKSSVSKPLAEIDDKPVIIHSLEILSKVRQISEIIVVVNQINKKKIYEQINKFRITKVKKIVIGAKVRQGSVKNGLSVVDASIGLVLIHDAARPLIDVKTVASVIFEAKKSGAAILGVPVKSTIKEGIRASGDQGIRVKNTLDRFNLWEIQTPQVFRKELIVEAYKKFGKHTVTDDSMLVEKLGHKVSLVMGSYKNIKITTPEDLIIAKAMARI